jgi:hypothetical protein
MLYENTIKRESSLSENEKVLSAYERVLINEAIGNLEVKEISEASWIDAAKKVAKDHQMIYINPKTSKTSDEKKKGFVILDATTANMLVNIANALSKETNQKFTSMPLAQAIDIGWKLIKK